MTPEIIKKESKNLNEGKTDPNSVFNSDCIKNGTEDLFFKLSMIFKSHITLFLLLATLVTIIKRKLESVNSSQKYRFIAISSLVLKLFDWIIIILFGVTIGVDDLQIAYPPGVSGNMCMYLDCYRASQLLPQEWQQYLLLHDGYV